MIDATLDSTKGEPMSHRIESRQRPGLVWVSCFIIGVAVFFGLVIKAASEYPGQSDGVPVDKSVPVQSYGPSDTSSIEDFYAKLLAPEDQPVDCQPSTGEPLADLMLGINAC